MPNATSPRTAPKIWRRRPALSHCRDQVTKPSLVATGSNDEDGPKAFYIHIEALPGKEDDVVQMLRDIFDCVLNEPATGPWYGVRYSSTAFGIFEAFPNIAGRDAHVAGGGGDIFRDLERMNRILAYPAHAYRVDILFNKRVFAERDG